MELAGPYGPRLFSIGGVFMYKFTIGSLEIVIYLVARIMKNNKQFFVKCTRGEWEPRPEVEYQLFRVIEITRDKKSELDYWFEVGTGQGPIDPLEWEAGAWWKFSSPYKLTLRVALDEKTHEVFKIGTWEQNGKWVLNVEHHDEPVEQPRITKPVPVETVYQHVEVIRPRHDSSNGRRRENDIAREKSRDFRRAKNSVISYKDDGRSERGLKEAPPTDVANTATEEETAKVLNGQHELVGRMDLSGLPKSADPANIN